MAPGEQDEKPATDDPSTGGQVSSAGSSFGDAETSNGGADAVPSTPDDVAEDYT